jgi:hypothetical protein
MVQRETNVANPRIDPWTTPGPINWLKTFVEREVPAVQGGKHPLRSEQGASSLKDAVIFEHDYSSNAEILGPFSKPAKSVCFKSVLSPDERKDRRLLALSN